MTPENSSPSHEPPPFQWKLASRTALMKPSAIREILKVTEREDIISFAGGLPSSKTFPVEEFKAACEKVLKDDPAGALQYAASEGYGPLREMLAENLSRQAADAGMKWEVDPQQVLITNGSQQGLDLAAKVMIDAGSKVLVESPTYLGALSAFTPMEPQVEGVNPSDDGLDLADFRSKAHGSRFLYVLPNFQNPTGRTMSDAARKLLSLEAAQAGIPILEDNPYGDLWFEKPPPAPLTALNPEGCIYLGSLSKVLAPGLRLGYLVAPKSVYSKLLQAKQASDLHSPGFNQRVAFEVMQNGFLKQHLPKTRALYKAQRDAMLSALDEHFPHAQTDPEGSLSWNQPQGGMFLWARLPKGMNAQELFPHAAAKGLAFVPGSPFFAGNPDARSMRLSFVTPGVDEIRRGVQILAQTIQKFTCT